MSKHLFGLIVTPYGAAANNRGENEGNITTLQKLLWKGDVHTTVSAEAIRWALRYFWERNGSEVNRRWDEDKYDHEWQDQTWAPWTSTDEEIRRRTTFIDDDILGFMLAEGASTDGNDRVNSLKDEKKLKDTQLKDLPREEKKSEHGKQLQGDINALKSQIDVLSRGKTDKRRGALEVSRAISLSPFAGDITFNAKSGTKNRTSLYGTEVHATRYQYAMALTPGSLRDKQRVLKVVDGVISLREVGGNHSRFLFDFSPSSIVFRWTDDFSPRMLYGFEMKEDSTVSFPAIVKKVASGDINPSELFIGGEIAETFDEETKHYLKGAEISNGIKTISAKLKQRIAADMGISVN